MPNLTQILWSGCVGNLLAVIYWAAFIVLNSFYPITLPILGPILTFAVIFGFLYFIFERKDW